MSEDELDFYHEVPLIEKAIRSFDAVVGKVFYTNFGIAADLVLVALLVFVITYPLRVYGNSIYFETGLIIVFIIIFLIFTNLFKRPGFQNRIMGYFFGGPVFGKIGGLPGKMFNISMRCADNLKLEFRSGDQEKVDKFNTVDRAVFEYQLKRNYEVYLKSENISPADPEMEWSKVWNERILEYVVDDTCLSDILSTKNFEFNIFNVRLLWNTLMISPFIKIFQVAIVYLLLLFLIGAIELIVVIQIGIALSFLVSLFWFIHHRYNLNEIPFLDTPETIPEPVRERYSEDIEMLKGRSVRPSSISFKKAYFSGIRDYLGSTALMITLINALSALFLTAVSFIAGFLLFTPHIVEIARFYQNLSIGLLIIPFGLIGGYYMTFWVLRNYRTISAPVVFGVLTLGLPFIIEYLITGKMDFDKASETINVGIVSSIVIALSGSIAAQAKEKLLESPD